MMNKADEAVAHRQCARNADALKSDEGNPALDYPS